MALICRWFVQRQYPGLPRRCGGRCQLRGRGPVSRGHPGACHRPSLRRVLSLWARTAPPAGTGLGCRVPTLGGARWPAARLHPHKSRALGWGCCPGFSPNSPVPGGHHGRQQVGTPEPMQSRLQKVCSVTPALMFGAGGGRGRAGGRLGKQAPPSSEVPGGPALALPGRFSQGSGAGEPGARAAWALWQRAVTVWPSAEMSGGPRLAHAARAWFASPWLLPTSPTPKGL